MADRAVIRVLLVGEEPREFYLSRQLFERSDCQCHSAKSEEEIAELLIATEFDIVLSTHRISGASIHQLVALLSGSRASMFCSLRVEEGLVVARPHAREAVFGNTGRARRRIRPCP
jgi:DNA-binding NtrC family response regulator